MATARFELIGPHLDLEVPNAPLPGLAVRVEKNVQPVPADGAAAIEHFHRSGIVVAWNDHFGAERMHLVGGDKCVPNGDAVAGSGLAAAVFSAALRAWAIGRHPHTNCSPFSGYSADRA